MSKQPLTKTFFGRISFGKIIADDAPRNNPNHAGKFFIAPCATRCLSCHNLCATNEDFDFRLFGQLLLGVQTLADVEVIEAAVGERPGTATLFTPGDQNGLASLHQRRDSLAREQNFVGHEVRMTTIDEILTARGIELVDFAKMDLEGHELFALRGAAESLKHHRLRALSFEFGVGNVNSRTFFRDFWDLLTGYGYRIERIYPGGKTAPVTEYYEDLEFFRGVTNYVALAPQKAEH